MDFRSLFRHERESSLTFVLDVFNQMGLFYDDIKGHLECNYFPFVILNDKKL